MEDLVGYRFRPDDEQIITYYLERKLRGLDFPVHVINEVDMNKLEPWDLPEFSAIQSDDPVWYFFTEPDYMDAKKNRINRKTPAGFWKVTGNEGKVKDRRGREIGHRRTLVYHIGRSPKGVGTCWSMQEYHYKDATKWFERPFVLCRIKRKSDGSDEPRPPSASNSGNHSTVNVVSQENHEISLDLQSIFDDELDANSLAELQLLLLPEEGPSCSNVSNYELDASRSQLDNNEQVDDFVNSILVADEDEHVHEETVKFVNLISVADEDEHVHEETVQTRLHDFKPVKPLSGYVADNSNFKVQTANAQVEGQLPETPTLFGGRSQGSYIFRPTYKLQAQGDGLHKKGEINLSRDKILKMAQISGKASSKLRSESSNVSSRKSSFIFWETPPSSHKQDPPSVYILNIVVALILLVFFVREMVSLH